MNRLIVAALVAASAASPVLAADIVIDAPTPAASSLAGYVEVAVGGHFGNSEWGYPGINYGNDEWNEILLTGAGRAAIPVAPQLTLQLDSWVRSFSGETIECLASEDDCSTYDYSGYRVGGAAHLAHAFDGVVIGSMVSLGARGDEDYQEWWGTAALEGFVSFDQFRLYGQVGVTRGLTEYPGDNNSTSVFAKGDLAYYVDPNLRVSANAGIDRYTGDEWDREEYSASWGARIEKKFEDTPFSLFASYQGWVWSGEDNETSWKWNADSHTIKVGARFAFGQGTQTLQDLDRAVGLKDMNEIYGDR